MSPLFCTVKKFQLEMMEQLVEAVIRQHKWSGLHYYSKTVLRFVQLPMHEIGRFDLEKCSDIRYERDTRKCCWCGMKASF